MRDQQQHRPKVPGNTATSKAMDYALSRWRALCVHLQDNGLGAPKRGGPAKNSVGFDARTSLFEASGVDLTRIPGIDTSTALKIISEIGVDL